MADEKYKRGNKALNMQLYGKTGFLGKISELKNENGRIKNKKGREKL